MQTRSCLTWGACALAWGVLCACGGGGKPGMKPAATAQKAQAEHAARAQAQGITLIAQVEKWPEGDQGRQVTPVRIQLVNDSEQPVAVMYEHFALVGGRGQHYAALPPFQLSEVSIAPAAVGFKRAIDREWKSQNFQVAPAYASLYQGVPVADQALDISAAYYNEYFGAWEQGERPSDAMLEYALPEGVLQPGGRLDGYLYFEKLSDKTERVELKADFVNASTGQTIDSVAIPFVED
jgi:hypothetical protein